MLSVWVEESGSASAPEMLTSTNVGTVFLGRVSAQVNSLYCTIVPQSWGFYSGPSKLSEPLFLPVGLNNFIRTLLCFSSILVKTLKQWMYFDLVLPHVEIHPKKRSRVVMKKICTFFLGIRIEWPTCPYVLGLSLVSTALSSVLGKSWPASCWPLQSRALPFAESMFWGTEWKYGLYGY